LIAFPAKAGFMQKKALTLLGVLTAVLGLCALCLLILLARTREARRQEASAVSAETQARTEQEQRAETLERERARLARQNQDLTTLATSLRSSAEQTRPGAAPVAPPPASSPAGAAPTGGVDVAQMLDKMMKDPAMKQMLRSQQKIVMDQMYGDLFKELQLSPAEREQFTGVLLDNAMKSMTHAGTVFQGEGEAKTTALQSIAEQQKEMNASLKTFLGDERYARYEDYQKTISERTQLNLFRQQMAEGAQPLQDRQVPQLLDILREERARVPSVLGDAPGQSAAMLKAVASEETMTQHFQWQEDLNQRVLDRAGQVLSPEQLKDYAGFLKSQLEMQKMGMNMARKMFGAPKGASPPLDGVTPVPVPVK
jgi:hypothetical protein